MKKVITFDELLTQYFFYKDLREETKRDYKNNIVKLLKEYPTLLPEDISLEIILNWRKNILKNNSKTTWNTVVRHLKALFNFGIENNLFYFQKNPFAGLLVKEDHKKKKTLTDLELEKIQSFLYSSDSENLKFIKPIWFYRALLGLLITTGIRRNQLLQLQLSDIDLVHKSIYISGEINKTHNSYIIPIVKKIFCDIEKLYFMHKKNGSTNNTQFFNVNIFKYKKTQKMTKYQLDSFFRYLSKYLGFIISTHRFRHTIATNLMRQDQKNLYLTQKLLGHKSIKTTLQYIEYDINKTREVLDSLF